MMRHLKQSKCKESKYMHLGNDTMHHGGSELQASGQVWGSIMPQTLWQHGRAAPHSTWPARFCTGYM